MNPIGNDAYYESLNKALAYIDSNLAGDLSLPAVAAVSGYSEFHFHRLFHALMGRNLLQYVHERRLTAAAALLLYRSRVTITEIAMDCGFSTSAGFTRSFREGFGCSPSFYRRSKKRKRPLEAAQVDLAEYATDPVRDASYCYLDCPNLHVAGIAARGMSERFESSEIESAFGRLFEWLRAHRQFREGTAVAGITMDTPEVVALGDCRYFACATVDESAQPEGEVFVREIPCAGKYSCFTLDRGQDRFAEVFFSYTDYLYGNYMPRFGLYPDNRPFLEFYRQNGGVLEITFCVPVQQRGE